MKSLISFLFLFLFTITNSFQLKNCNVNLGKREKNSNEILYADSDSNSYIHFDISNNPYTTDIISLNGTLDKIYNVDCTSSDISIITWDQNKQNDVLFEFKISTKEKEFKIELSFLDSSNTLCANKEFYFYNTELGIFISQISNSNNIENYKSYSLKKELITQAEYDEYNSSINNNSVIQTASTLDNSKLMLPDMVVGKFNWTDGNGNIHPLRNCYVELIKQNGNTLSVVNKTYTTDEGSYSFIVNDGLLKMVNSSSYIFTKLTYLFIRIYSKTEHSGVVKSLNLNNYYYFDTNTIGLIDFTSNLDIIDRSYTFLNNSNDSSYISEAFQITQALYYGEKYAFEIGTVHPDFEKAEYPSQEKEKDGASHSNVNGIYLGQYTYCYWDIILHEYGHHLQAMLDISNYDGMPHYSSKPSNDFALNWGESWPTVFANLVTKYYSSELTGIPYINDDNYDAPNGENIHVTYSLENLENNIKYGEYCERDIMYVLFDLFDENTNESFDKITLGHQGFWNAVKNSKAYNFYQFSKYLLSSNIINSNDYSKLLEEYGMSPTNITCSPITSLISSPTISWYQYHYESAKSKIEISNEWGVVIFEKSTTTLSNSLNCKLSQSEWEKILLTYGKQFRIRIISTLTNTTDIQHIYSSEYYYFDKPIINIKESFTYEENTRLIEKDIKIYPGTTATFSIRFTTTGNKLFQTLGSLDTKLYLYNETTGALIASDDNSGAILNALINYKLTPTFRFKIIVKAGNNNITGDTRLVITQVSDSNIQNYDDIFRINERNCEYKTYMIQYSSNVLCFVPEITGKYQIKLTSSFDNYLYFFDYNNGYSQGENVEYNNNFDGTNAQLTLKLQPGRPYLVFICCNDASINFATDNVCTISINYTE